MKYAHANGATNTSNPQKNAPPNRELANIIPLRQMTTITNRTSIHANLGCILITHTRSDITAASAAFTRVIERKARLSAQNATITKTTVKRGAGERRLHAVLGGVQMAFMHSLLYAIDTLARILQ
jgi:hypothetical protein